jgi:hypothetical protein
MTIRFILSVIALGACTAPLRRFPQQQPMRSDPDMVPFAPRPAKYESPQVWNTVDNMFFRPLSAALAVKRARNAKNVNALDEVPDSSWFTNRIDTIAADPQTFADGPCKEPPDPGGPWTVIGGKPNGQNPGFLVQHASGRRYLFKLDGGSNERASTADVIGSRFYYAAGYNAPCNVVIFIDPTKVVLSPSATVEDFLGDKVPFTQAMLDAALANGTKRPDGTIRGGLSLLLPGALGPWKDFGTRADDPNDVIPHEDRRELRGSYIFGAWLGHYDAREQNSLDIWVDAAGGTGFIRHYMLDFGDCLGSTSGYKRVSARRGHTYELEWPIAFSDLVTFGALDRPWRHPRRSRRADIFGYFTAESFEPDHYRTAYPFGPYARMREADAAWGARILARMTPELIHAVIGEARLSDPDVAAELERTLLGRRDKLLRRYLGHLSPFERPRIDEHGQLCVSDARREAGLESGASERCIEIKPGASYRVVDVEFPGTPALRVHLYRDTGSYRIAGIEREW